MAFAARVIVAALIWLASAIPTQADQQIARYQKLTASISDNASCGAAASITVHAPDASAYTGDRIALQHLLGAIRANFSDCPDLQSLDLTGLANGHPAFYATLSARDGWKLPTGVGRILAENPPPSSNAQSAHCDYDPGNPLVGCWLSIAPDEYRKHQTITNIHSNSAWDMGNPERLASGSPEDNGPRIEVTHDVLKWAGLPHFALFWSSGASSGWTGPYFHDDCNIMMLKPYAPFGINFARISSDLIFVRLRPLTVTADILSRKKHSRSIETSIPDKGRLFNYCPDSFDQANVDSLISRLLPLAIPLLGEMSLAEASELLPTSLARKEAAEGVIDGRIAAGADAASSVSRVESGAVPATLSKNSSLVVRGSDVKTVGMQVQGRFPTTPQTPNAVMYRMNNNGSITSYQVWAADGLPAYRVDVVGASHGNISTPHVVEFGRNTTSTGQVFVAKPSLPRPATSVEVP